MGLHPLEFSDCIVDSPYFRDKLHQHEKELERTSKALKTLITDSRELLVAAKSLSKAQRIFSKNLIEFKFETIGEKQTDDEVIIADSLKEVGRLIADIEDERDRLLDQAFNKFLPALEAFRKEEIGAAKESKKRFDKQTAKFCGSLERYLALKANKSSEVSLQEADAALEMERTAFYQQSMNHVLLLQQVQEKKKFEFVEVLLTFVYSWLAFYHQGQEVYKDFKPYMTELQFKLQKMRENFKAAQQQAEELMNKTLEKKLEAVPMKNKEGYLYFMEKKALSTNWVKHYCRYLKDTKQLLIVPYTQTAGGKMTCVTETLTLTSCTRRAAETIEKRFCFDITVADRQGTITAQALNEDDRRSWLDIMDGKEPIYQQPQTYKGESSLDDAGFCFITKCISALDSRGLEEQGLYRVVGVNSKVQKLTQLGLDRKRVDKLNLDEEGEYEIKTITSAIKNYFRSLPEPLMTFELHSDFMQAAKNESKTLRIHDIHCLVHKLPEANYRMLHILMRHLKKVSDHCSINLMSVANLAVCFGPTLMRPPEETLAAIIDIKFCNVIVEILITNYEKIFNSPPEGSDVTVSRLNPNVPKPERMSASFTSSMTSSLSSSMTSSMASSSSSIDDTRTITPTSNAPSLPGDSTSSVTSPMMGQNHDRMAISGGDKFGSGLKYSPVGSRTNGGGGAGGQNGASSVAASDANYKRPGSAYAAMSSSSGTGISSIVGSSSPGGSNVTASGVVLRPRHARSGSSISADNVDSGGGGGAGSGGGGSGGSGGSGGGGGGSAYLQAKRGLRSVMGSAATSDMASTSSTSSSSESLTSKTSSTTQSSHQSIGSTNSTFTNNDAQRKQPAIYTNLAKAVRYVAPLSVLEEEFLVSEATSARRQADDSRERTARSNTYPYWPRPVSLTNLYPIMYATAPEYPPFDRFTYRPMYYSPQVNRSAGYDVSAPVPVPRKSETVSATLERSSGSRAPGWRKVRTLYACTGDNVSELTFEPNEIIHNVRTSREVGWLEGTLNGRTGLIPANYVEFLN